MKKKPKTGDVLKRKWLPHCESKVFVKHMWIEDERVRDTVMPADLVVRAKSNDLLWRDNWDYYEDGDEKYFYKGPPK